MKQGDDLGPILFVYLINAVIIRIDDHWQNIRIPKFRHHGYKPTSTIIKYNPDMNQTTKHATKGLTFAFNKPLYVDDMVF